MATKVKISKRHIKEDKFTATMLRTKDWLMENWQTTALIAAAVIVVIVGIVYFSGQAKVSRIENANRLAEAVSRMRQMDFQAAILELQELADNAGGYVGSRAQFYLANAHYESRNFDEAVSAYEEYIRKYDNDRLTKASAIAGIAACYENKQEYIPAASQYMEAIEYYPDSPLAPDYYLGAVRNYVLAGNVEKATEIAEEMESKFPDLESTRIAIRQAASLKAK